MYGEDHVLSGELCRKVAIMYEEDEKDLNNAFSYYQRCLKIFDMVCNFTIIFLTLFAEFFLSI